MQIEVSTLDHKHGSDKRMLPLDQIIREVLTGYCRDLPYEVVERVIAMYKRYGELVAMEAAVIAVKTHEITKQF